MYGTEQELEFVVYRIPERMDVRPESGDHLLLVRFVDLFPKTSIDDDQGNHKQEDVGEQVFIKPTFMPELELH
ncbi:hypothetical protein SDC9_87391 [bioreactor metagenome]|uniref:Uncharacterized protein n=1 Tax=bioreactor metagenome TaxID=1076179 RepID=A0A644ZQ10_9ZZZZ